MLDWWWIDTFLYQVQAGGAILSVGLGIAAIVAAWRIARKQFRMIEDQGRIINEQTTLMSEQRDALAKISELAESQETINRRQGEIAETQYAIAQAIMGRRSKLSMAVTPLYDLERGMWLWRVRIHNDGNKTEPECAWNIYIMDELWTRLHVQKWDGTELPLSEDRYTDGNGDVWRPFYGELKKSLWPDSEVACATIVVDTVVASRPEKYFPMTLRWSVRSEGGRVPEKGYNLITLEDPGFRNQ